MEEEFVKAPHLDKDGEQEVFKANLCLAGIIVAFVLLTFMAYLFNEGRNLFLIPIIKWFTKSGLPIWHSSMVQEGSFYLYI